MTTLQVDWCQQWCVQYEKCVKNETIIKQDKTILIEPTFVVLRDGWKVVIADRTIRSLDHRLEVDIIKFVLQFLSSISLGHEIFGQQN